MSRRHLSRAMLGLVFQGFAPSSFLDDEAACGTPEGQLNVTLCENSGSSTPDSWHLRG
jgi:hypothetical protein